MIRNNILNGRNPTTTFSTTNSTNNNINFNSNSNSNNLDKVSKKILVLGDSGVGKSSLINLICHSTVLKQPQWTVGCSVDIKLHGDCYLDFRDIGGSRGHQIARSFLYTNYHGIILVFDAANSKSRFNLVEWLAEVSRGSQGKIRDRDYDSNLNINVPIITIATNKDRLPYGKNLDFDDRSNSPFTNSQSGEDGQNSNDSSVIDFNNPNTQDTIPQPTRKNSSRSTFQNNYATSSDYNHNPTIDYPLRRHNTASSLPTTDTITHMTRYDSASFLLPRHSSTSSLTSNAMSLQNQQQHHHHHNYHNNYQMNTYEALTKNEVILVNTQDVFSFKPGSKNSDMLNNFFENVINDRNYRF